MKVTTWVSAIALAGAATLAGSPVWAAAGDNCVKILGYEWSGEKQSMDPADMHSGDDAYHTFAVYNRLVDVDDNFKVLPELATEWSVSDDGLTWTFHLRKGVKFHSGKDFTSAELDHLLAFYQSPLGKKLIASQGKLEPIISKQGPVIAQSIVNEAIQKMAPEMKKRGLVLPQ